MFKSLCLASILIFTACSHSPSNQEVSSFMQSWHDQYESRDKRYSEKYERYLNSVAKVYEDNNQEKKFRSYLDSLNSNSQTLTQQQETLPDLYRQKTGRAIASDVSSYELFKTLEMTKLYDNLFDARELKLKDEVGEKLYQDLQANYKDFMVNEQADEFGFPL